MNKLSEEEIINAIKPIVNARKTHKDNELYSLQLNAYQLDVIEALLDLYNQEKEKNKELTLITNQYDSFPKYNKKQSIIIASPDYFQNGTFVKKFISKDKIKEKIKENKKMTNVIPTENNYTYKELMKYGIDILQELLEEEKENG